MIKNRKKSVIVIVDDNDDEIYLTRHLLRKERIVNDCYDERKPEHLIKTLDALVEAGHDPNEFLILLDINMPKQSGFETLDVIRGDESYNEIPVIMLSASDDEHDIFEAIERGGDGYLTKPFSGMEFFSAVENIPAIKKQLVQ